MAGVPDRVSEILEDIRQSGETNMLDRKTVQYLTHEQGAHETVVWLEEHRDDYAELLANWKRL